MRFDWDDAKAERNRQKHGVTFGEAATVFLDPFALSAPDVAHSADEDRERTIGRSNRSRVLFVVTAETSADGQQVRRIITARRATTSEEQRYADHLKAFTQGGRRQGRRGRRRP